MKKISLIVCLLMSLILTNCTEEVVIVGSPPDGSIQVADSSEDDAADDTVDDSTDEDDSNTSTEEECASCYFTFEPNEKELYCNREGAIYQIDGVLGEEQLEVLEGGKTFRDYLDELEEQFSTNLSGYQFVYVCDIE